MERADGTQARLKLPEQRSRPSVRVRSGKGGWDSGEIETIPGCTALLLSAEVERADGTQARLKRKDQSQSCIVSAMMWKGRMGLRRD